MKEYVEDRLNPFRIEATKIYNELNKIFPDETNYQQGIFVKSVRSMQAMHESILKKYSNLKVTNNKNEARLESQIKLNQHLEDTLSTTIKDKDDTYIQLKSEIRVLEQKLEDSQSKLTKNVTDETIIEQECRELRERIEYSEKLLDVHIHKNKELETTNTFMTERVNTLEKEMEQYKEQTQQMIDTKNTELVDLRSRLAIIDQEYTEKINIIVMEKENIKRNLELESSEAELLNMKLSVMSNKIK